MREWIFFSTLVFFASAQVAECRDIEDDRLPGFAEHNWQGRRFEKQREQGSEKVKKERLQWEEQREKSLASYKKWKSLEGKTLDESSAAYRKEVEARKKRDQELENARLEYVRRRDAERSRANSVLLTEEQEYDISTSKSGRVPVEKRVLGHGSASAASPLGDPGRRDFGGTPPVPGTGDPSMPLQSPPEFYEPEIPPPPPPPEMGFEGDFAPPVVDEPGF